MKYVKLSEAIVRFKGIEYLWSFMGRKNNSGNKREWFVAACVKNHRGCSGFYVFE